MNLAELTNAPREVELAGQTYKVSALKVKEWGLLQSWILEHVPGPVASLRSEDMKNLSPLHARQMLDLAVRQQHNWPPAVGSEAWMHAMDYKGGHAKFLHVLLSRHQPDFTEAEAAELAEKVDDGQVTSGFVQLVLIAMNLREDSDPNSPAPEGATTTPG